MPDRVVSCHGHKQRRPITAQDKTIWRRSVSKYQLYSVIQMETEHAACWVVKAGHSLVREDDGTVGVDDQIIRSFEVLAVEAGDNGLYDFGFGVKR